MIIALIYYKIKPGCEDDYLEYWKKKSVIHDRTGLMGEYLCNPASPEELSYITWMLPSDGDPEHTPFVNVGIWTDAQSFHDQICEKFNDQGPL